jgi:hypothetical protein
MPSSTPLLSLIFQPAFRSLCNIVLLPLLGSTQKQKNNLLTVFTEIDPVSGTKIDPVFKIPAATTLYIQKMPQAQTTKSSGHATCSFRVQPFKPFAKRTAPIQFEKFSNLYLRGNGRIYFPFRRFSL